MSWPRPIPVLGDTSSVFDRAIDPGGWSMDDATQTSVADVIAARRDIRRFRPDPVPPELLTHVLDAGHSAPSVGQSQPWRFVVVRAQSTRDRASYLADRERIRQANALTDDRRSRLLDLKVEGIRDAPVGIVVACDRRTPPEGVLGRATFPDADMWSCACAIQNMWLTARAAGLGMGWVTFFQPPDLAELLHLPEGVETLGWMCLGWPDERPPEPGLQRRGWSKRMDLDEVTFAERWPEDGSPQQPVSHLSATGPDQQAVVSARDTGANRLTVPGSLGLLDTTIDRILALDREQGTGSKPTGTLVLAGADHPVASYGVSTYEPKVTDDVLRAARSGVSLGASTASAAGLTVEVVHASIDHAGDLVTSDAMSAADAESLVEQGVQLGQQLGGGLVCLADVGIGNTTVAAAMVCAMLDVDVHDAVGLGSDADSATVARKTRVVERAVTRARQEHGTKLASNILAALGGPEIAILAGVTIGAARNRTPVILDGLVTSVAALWASRRYSFVHAALVAGQRSREHAHDAVLNELGLEPLLDLRFRAGEGVGACLAAQLVATGIESRIASAEVADSRAG